MTVATRGKVHSSVLNPWAPGPARKARSTFANCVVSSFGFRPARPAPFRPRRPFACHT
jgi:hypothetical protein